MAKSLKNRLHLWQEIKTSRRNLQEHPDSPGLILDLAPLLYQYGNFAEARQVLLPLAQETHASTPMLSLMADLEYLLGNYAGAETLATRVLAEDPSNISAIHRLVLTWYQTNQFQRVSQIPKEMEEQICLPIYAQMKDFTALRPYQMEWKGEKKTVIPFTQVDPLPVIEIVLEGHRMSVIIDTGGDSLIVDTEMAEELGLQTLTQATGTFGGGKQALVGYSRANQLEMNGVILHHIPVTLLPTRRFSKDITPDDRIIDGILGTGILKQFLSTLDYPGKQLILRERSAHGRKLFRQETGEKNTNPLHFALFNTHWMLAKGGVNDLQNLTFFVDSGLAHEAAFAAPCQTLEMAHIPLPETHIDEDSSGGGGGAWASGTFKVEQLGLGSLVQKHLLGEYGSRTPETYWQAGFIIDGLISHSFLKRYAWTLDFDAMLMHFMEAVEN